MRGRNMRKSSDGFAFAALVAVSLASGTTSDG
jgi:hypothetical protein